MKNKHLKKRLLLESLAFIAVLGVLGGALNYLIGMHEEQERDNNTVNTQLTALRNELQALDGKYNGWRQNNALYETAIKKKKQGRLMPDRAQIRSLFTRYNEQFMLSETSLQMQPLQELEGAEYKRPTANMVYSVVTVSFNALNDLDVYRLIQAIEKDFSGAVKMRSVSITKRNKASKEILASISQTGPLDMVAATITFFWVGIRQPEPDKKAENK